MQTKLGASWLHLRLRPGSCHAIAETPRCTQGVYSAVVSAALLQESAFAVSRIRLSHTVEQGALVEQA